MGTITVRMAVITAVLGGMLMLPACKKEGAPGQADQQKMLQKSFEASKKGTAATVNGQAITEFAVYREMNTLRPQYLQAGQKPSSELDAKIRKDALDVLITQELAVQEAAKRGMKVQPQAIDDAVAKMRKSAGSEEAFQKQLAENGLSEKELREMIGRDALFEVIAANEVDKKIVVTDAALRARYAKERAALKGPEHRRMTYEEAKGPLEERMRAEAAQKRMAEWEKELRKGASIEIVGNK